MLVNWLIVLISCHQIIEERSKATYSNYVIIMSYYFSNSQLNIENKSF